MAKYNVATTGVTAGLLYSNVGAQSVIYNSVTYTTGQTFRGVAGVTTFSYSGSGTQIVNELTELQGSFIEFSTNITDIPTFPVTTTLNGGYVQFAQNPSELQTLEVTTLFGGDVEFVEAPGFIFTINKRNGSKNPEPVSQILPTKIAYFGDSMTASLPDGYPVQVNAINGVTYVNYGVGATTVCTNTYAPVGGNQNLIDLYHNELDLGYSGQLVSFAFGHNDVGALTNATWKATYKSIIQAFITAGWPLTRLLILVEPESTANILSRAQSRIYIYEIAAELGIMRYDVLQRFVDTRVNDTLYVDTVHPTIPGHAVWASGYDTFVRR